MNSLCNSPRLIISEATPDDTVPIHDSSLGGHCGDGRISKENTHVSVHERTTETKENSQPSAFRPLPLSTHSLLLQQQLYALLASQLNTHTLVNLTAQGEPENSIRSTRLRTESPTSTVSESPRKGEILDYAERRRRNNDSARRSREVRRQREQENRLKMEVLEKENAQLRGQINMLRLELSQLSLMVMQKGGKAV